MTDKVEINHALKESVALEMAKLIAKQEGLSGNDKEYRQKFLDLYHECLEATKGLRDF